MKVMHCILLVNFYKKVIYDSYILLYQKVTLLYVLLYNFITSKSM